MQAPEGVIQYQLEFQEEDFCAPEALQTLESWRAVLYRLQLLGQDPQRYGGLGFGNLSLRYPVGQRGFLVTGSQTGHLQHLDSGHYAWVYDWSLTDFRLRAKGRTPPSSEALTHAMFYELDTGIQAVVHVHSPDIWRQSARLGLAETPADVGYGTQAMTEAVRQLYRHAELNACPCLVMRGHEDGVIVFGTNLEAAVMRLLQIHSAALKLT